MTEWTAHLTEDWTRPGRRLFLHRRIGDRVEVVIGFSEHGDPIIQTIDPLTTHDFPGLLLPTDAAEAIAHKARPGPTAAEVKRLDDALALERRRVDDILRASITAIPHPGTVPVTPREA